jgi:two-component system, NtrC family, sensor histidine kinase HydH
MKLGIAAEAQAPRAHGLSTRLAWMTGLRLAFFTLLLVATAIFYLGGELARYPTSLRIVFVTIAAAFALAAVYAAILRTGKRLTDLAYAQIVLDQATWTALVYVTGGASSGATSFYAFTCLVGAILVGLRGAALAAVVGAVMYGLLCACLSAGVVAPPHDQAQAYVTSASELVYPMLVNGLGIGVVALLAGYLAERLRITGGALLEATARAMEAERLAALGRIAAGLAHEIRNPLGSISGSIDILGESPALSSEDKELCAIIRREASRLNNLVTDMLDLSKPRAPEAEAVDVAALARDVVALAARTERSGTGDVSVLYDGPANVTLARCDGGQMRQVLWNLVRNAVQASGAGKSVHVRVEPHGKEVTLRVDDEGPGIPDEARARLFDAFYTTRSHGVGIGLAVVKRIIDDHAKMGARIDVVSPESGGASFRVTLTTDVGELPPSRASLRPPKD